MTDEIVSTEPITVFITGVVTPAGQALTHLLKAQGHNVVGAVSNPYQAEGLRSAGGTPAYPDLYRVGELRSAIAGTGAKVVVNLAPQIANYVPQIDGAWDLRIAEAAEVLVQAAAEAGVEYLVHTSYAFADAQTDEHTAEARPFLKVVRAAERAVLEGQLPACVLRLGTLYGAESPELIKLFDIVKAGGPVHPGFDHPIYWLYSVDAAEAINAAIQVRPTSETLALTDDHPSSAVEFLQYFAGAQGIVAPEKPPRFALRRPFSKLHEAVQNLHYEAGNAAAKEELNWTPRFPDYQRGIDDLLISWRTTEPVGI